EDLDIDGHAGAFAALRPQLQRDAAGTPVTAIAHRVVHGGDRYAGPVVIDAAVEAAIAALSPLAPLHNPASLAVIRVARDAFPAVPQLAVFDTAFHQTLPDHAWRYAVAEEISRRGVRRHGFHGISHADVARRAAPLPAPSPLAPLHNPASLAALRVARAACPAVPQLAVFDTAFHQTLPDHAWRYAVAEEISRRGVRRHGFHGISHADVARRAA